MAEDLKTHLRFELQRDDGDVHVLEGSAGLAVMIKAPPGNPIATVTDRPEIVLRADNTLQLALLVAAVIAAAQVINPAILESAAELATHLDFTHTALILGGQPPAEA